MKKLKAGDTLVVNIQIGEVRVNYTENIDEPLNVNEFVISGLLHELADKIVAGDVKLIEEAPT